MRAALLPGILLALSIWALSGNAAPAGKTMLVMDASGSMWSKVDGDYKIVIARQVISDLMKSWDPDIQLGLSAYGHNTKGSCSDIETLIMPATHSGPRIAATVNRLNPRGKTPLTAAVIQAADALEFETQPASVILLSDGEETCGLDPCTIGASLEERGIDFTVYVIGFNVAVSNQVGLRCLAEETGGAFLAADSAEELRAALGSVSRSVATGVNEFAGKDAKAAEAINLSAFIARDVPITTGDVSWGIRRIGDDGRTSGEDFLNITGTSVTARLPPGLYRVHARYGGAFKYMDVQSGAGQEGDVPLVFGAGRLRIEPRVDGDLAPDPVLWTAYPLEIDQQPGSVRDSRRDSGPVEFVLNEGLYRITGELPGYAPRAFEVLIQAGELVQRQASFERE